MNVEIGHIFGAFAKLLKATVSFVMSVCLSARNNSAPTGRIFMKFYICVFFEDLSRKFKFHYNLTRVTGTLHEGQCTFLITPHSILRRMRNVSYKTCRENQNADFVLSNFFFFFRNSCRLGDNAEKHCSAGQATDDNMAHAHSMLGTEGYKHTLRICNTYCISAAKVVARTRRSVA